MGIYINKVDKEVVECPLPTTERPKLNVPGAPDVTKKEKELCDKEERLAREELEIFNPEKETLEEFKQHLCTAIKELSPKFERFGRAGIPMFVHALDQELKLKLD